MADILKELWKREDTEYQPYTRITGGPVPVGVSWSDIPSIADADISFEGLSTDKVSFDGQIDAGSNIFYGIKWDSVQTKSVGINGEPYNRIQNAHDSIYDSTSTKPYVIDIKSGVFVEQITLSKPYVNIKGQGADKTQIQHPTNSGALITITTGLNNSVLEISDIKLSGGGAFANFISCAATGITISFVNCLFKLTTNTVTYFINQPTSAGNTIKFVNCVFEVSSGLDNAQFIIFNTATGTTTDIVNMTACILKSHVCFGIIGYSSVNSTSRYYLTGIDTDGFSSAGLVTVDGGKVYVEAGRWGKPEYSAGIFNIRRSVAEMNVVGAHIYSGSGSVAVTCTEGTLNITASEIKGGQSGIRTYAGVTTVRNSTINKHVQGDGYDLYNGGGALNISFVEYSTSTGTITRLNEDVDKVDGKHASVTPTADTIPVSDGSAKVDGWVSGDKHNTGGDTALGTLGAKNPPIDADKSIYRDSTASDGLVTSTWAQVKAFLKTYWDTLYLALTGGTLTGNLAISKTLPTSSLTDEDGNSAVSTRNSVNGEYKKTNKVYKPGVSGTTGDGIDDAYTKALLHFDGTDASTTFIDESGKIWTRYGNAQIDTAQSKFGGASGLFDGAGDYITTPDHNDFNLGSGNFTVDLRVRFN
ncbi:MAG: hypothetical protein QME51_04520, partial [Planctomycetota bacterium]|nr:hypothetical protein [Planctomycetota bacterium]